MQCKGRTWRLNHASHMKKVCKIRTAKLDAQISLHYRAPDQNVSVRSYFLRYPVILKVESKAQIRLSELGRLLWVFAAHIYAIDFFLSYTSRGWHKMGRVKRKSAFVIWDFQCTCSATWRCQGSRVFVEDFLINNACMSDERTTKVLARLRGCAG